MSPAGHQNGGGGTGVFFNVGAAVTSTGAMPAPDSPAPGSSSSSSGSILERALAKQEPPSPHMAGGGGVPVSSTPPSAGQEWQSHPVPGGGPGPGFSDVNVDEYIKHDFVGGMEGMVEYQGYATASQHHQQAAADQQHAAAEQYHHQYHTAVSVGPPWVR